MHAGRRNVAIAAATKTDKKDASSAARQMMGMKGAAEETNIWKIRVQLTKPVTWIPLIWGARMTLTRRRGWGEGPWEGGEGYSAERRSRSARSCWHLGSSALRSASPRHEARLSLAYKLPPSRPALLSADRCGGLERRGVTTPTGVACGAAASGHYTWNNPTQIAQLLTCMMMSGPFLTGYTQTINDWFDREIDAINEPYRPIPSGRISEADVKAQILVLLAAGLGTAFLLDNWVGHEQPTLLALAAIGSLISYIYSAPPLKLKQSGWAGNYALGSSYIALPWWAGQVGAGGGGGGSGGMWRGCWKSLEGEGDWLLPRRGGACVVSLGRRWEKSNRALCRCQAFFFPGRCGSARQQLLSAAGPVTSLQPL